jgi:hypothetical protein
MSENAVYKSPWKLLPPSDFNVIFESDSSAVLCGDLNYKYPSSNSRADNLNGHNLEAYAVENGLCILGPQQLTQCATAGAMDVLGIVILEGVGLTTAIEGYHELSSSSYSRIRREEDTEDYHPLFTNWNK